MRRPKSRRMPADIQTFHVTRLLPLLDLARSHVEQLLVVGGGSWQARSGVLQATAAAYGLGYIAIGRPFAQTLLGQPPRERAMAAMELLANLGTPNGSGLALDHIEILFDPELRLDPLRAVQVLSCRQPVLLSWPGQLTPERLSYARPDHPEYHTYLINDLLTYSLENLT